MPLVLELLLLQAYTIHASVRFRQICDCSPYGHRFGLSGRISTAAQSLSLRGAALLASSHPSTDWGWSLAGAESRSPLVLRAAASKCRVLLTNGIIVDECDLHRMNMTRACWGSDGVR